MFDVVRKILDMLTPYERRRLWLMLGILSGIAVINLGGVASVIPFLTLVGQPELIETDWRIKAVYDGLGFTSHVSFTVFVGVMVAIAFQVTILARALTVYINSRFAQMRAYNLSRRIMSGYLAQPYDWFLNRHSADLVRTLLGEMSELVGRGLVPMLNIVSNGLVLFTLIGLLIYMNWVAAITVAGVLGTAFVVVFLLVKRPLKEQGAKRIEFNRQRFRIASETMHALKEIKVLCLERSAMGRYRNSAYRFANQVAKTAVLTNVPQQLLEGLTFAVMIAVMLAMFLANDGDVMDFLPVAGAYAVAGSRILPAMKTIFAAVGQIRTVSPLVDRIHEEYVQLGIGREARPEPAPMGLSDRLELRNVSYAYPSAGKAALRDATLDIRASTTVGIVGGTGAGKTTTLDILLGLLEPQSGSLIVDGVVIDTDQKRRAWRRSIGYVSQAIYLAAGSVAENIALGVPRSRIDMKAVERASRLAQIHDFIVSELPEGYESEVGERGVKLSGGQRQRIGIARALYRDPDILVFDEATSALDSVTERTLMAAIDGLGGDKTIVMVAHRLSTVRNCDEIFLFEEGRVVARGRFEDLVKGNATFREMARGAA